MNSVGASKDAQPPARDGAKVDFLYIIDTTTPVFKRHDAEFVNWSKAPHHELEQEGKLKKKVQKKIRSGFKTFLKTASEIGYNAITVDELSYILKFDEYPDHLLKKIDRYRKYYRRLFHIARHLGFKIFVTTDVMFFYSEIQSEQKTVRRAVELLGQGLLDLFDNFPEVDGVIFRIGESDGVDVQKDLRSELVLRTPEDARYLLENILPVFEKKNKLLILRTWTIGAHEIGDLIWNPETYDRIFSGINSKNLIISMKYGETDFFRFQKLHAYFFKDSIPKIIELQARREYEGFGMFPNFPAIDYALYRDQLRGESSFRGIQVWSQTGGWSRFKNFTFLKQTSLWNELNTYVALRLFKYDEEIKTALRHFIHFKKLTVGEEPFFEFLQYADTAVKELLYDPGFGQKTLYLNRSRVPSLIHVTWDHLTANEGIALLYRLFGSSEQDVRSQGADALENIKRMRDIARKYGIPYDYRYHYHTFRIFFLVRLAMVQKDRKETLNELHRRIDKYRVHYPESYRLRVSLGEKAKYFLYTDLFIKLCLRQRRKYRFVDHILFNPFMASIYMLFFLRFRDRFPDFIERQAMSLRDLLS